MLTFTKCFVLDNIALALFSLAATLFIWWCQVRLLSNTFHWICWIESLPTSHLPLHKKWSFPLRISSVNGKLNGKLHFYVIRNLFVLLVIKKNFSFTNIKINFVCFKPIFQVFQVIIKLFVHFFDGMTEVSFAIWCTFRCIIA